MSGFVIATDANMGNRTEYRRKFSETRDRVRF